MRALYALRQDVATVGFSQENDVLVALSRIRFALETWGGRNAYIGTYVHYEHSCRLLTDPDPEAHHRAVAGMMQGI